jgi:ubiquinone/menaquinone biosynthesis C-methylase UbiE
VKIPESEKFIPALGFHLFTPFYDLIVGLTGRERTVKQALIRRAEFRPGQKVLDLACGTGTLAVMAKKYEPALELTGVDADHRMLDKAKRKAESAALSITFDRALSFSLPYADACFDQVLSTMFFHHLTWDEKIRSVREVYRVLRPGGLFYVADWGAPDSRLMRLLFLTVQVLDGFATTRDHIAGRMPELFSGQGFIDVKQPQAVNTIYGTIALYSAAKPFDAPLRTSDNSSIPA